MNDGIVDGNDLAIDLHGGRNPYVVLSDHSRQGLGDGGLANSRGAVEKNRGSGVERGSQLGEGLGIDHKVGEGLLHVGWVNDNIAYALFADLGYVALKRHRRDARVLILDQQLRCSRSARRSDGKVGDVAIHPRNLTVHICPHPAKQLVGYLVAEVGLPGEVRKRHGTGQIENLECEVFEN